MVQAEVTLTLNRKQQSGFNKWDCTIQDEIRTVTQQRVTYVVEDYKNAMSSFKREEVIDVDVRVNFMN